MSAAPLLEIACFSAASAVAAQQAGADRVELCLDYAAGGVTPDDEMISKVRQALQIPLHVIIRPRGGNFVYTVTELAQMKASVRFCRSKGVDGVVFGCLTSEKEVDTVQNAELLNEAGPLSVTFHRAIDACADIKQAFSALIRLGIPRVLTSGGESSALKGLPALRILQRLYGQSIRIMPGGGIRSDNISGLLSTGCKEYHTAAISSGSEVDVQEVLAIRQTLGVANKD